MKKSNNSTPGNPNQSIIKGGNIFNPYGLDTISAGATIGFAMDLYDRGVITKEETGVDLSWGNADGILAMLELMGKREGFGDVLADDVKVAAEKIGKNAAEFAYHVQGQELPMHYPLAGTYPGVMIGDPPIGVGPLAEVAVGIEPLEREWLEAYHWDVNATKPDPEHLKNIGMPELAKELGMG